MSEKKEKIEELYKSLDEKNKVILKMVAEGMKIAQEKNDNHIPHVD